MLSSFVSLPGLVDVMLFFALGAIAPLFVQGNDELAGKIGNSFAILGSLAALVFSGEAFFSGAHVTFAIPATLPGLSFSFNIDPLSSFFMMVIALIAFLCSIYALGYVKQFFGRYHIGLLGFLYNTFIAAMVLVVDANNLIFFLVVWEVMTFASFFLVIYEHRERENLHAGLLYLTMAAIGTGFIIFAFLLLYGATGSFDLSVIKAHAGMITTSTASAIFLAALVGFGIKAGIIPLHSWLPAAHPAAPSHVSALMSGVMIKIGIYMFVRLFFDVLPHAPLWWGIVVLVAGAASSVLGVLYALSEHDIKRLLAYHSIENIGIILLGLGTGLMFHAQGLNDLAAVAVVAALFHTLGHATFKSLLFLAAGAVVSRVHTRNIEAYGGLLKYMPATGLFFLVGSMAISALPPFNGFASEWLTFQSMFVGVTSTDFGQGTLFVLAIAALGLTGGLAAACFVKVFGATFLARPRSREVTQATEVSYAMRIGMGMIALLTLVFGVGAGTIARLLGGVAQGLVGLSDASIAHTSNSVISIDKGVSTLSMPAVFFALVGLFGVVYVIVSIVTRDRKVVIDRTWDCGTTLAPRMEITATAFSLSIIQVLRGILRPSKQTEVVYNDANLRYFPKETHVHLSLTDLYRGYLHAPLEGLFTHLSEYTKKIQSGNISLYVLYMGIALVGLLLTLAM